MSSVTYFIYPKKNAWDTGVSVIDVLQLHLFEYGLVLKVLAFLPCSDLFELYNKTSLWVDRHLLKNLIFEEKHITLLDDVFDDWGSSSLHGLIDFNKW